ncbi:MAG: FGGY-family carbohydrate kinase, partial [Dehalococcoidales bacterium]|nr:FGGY-family carbohydrate kinase [Dehalococcoidales bacterium]
STTIKAIVYDYKGNMIAKGSAVTPLSYLDPEHPAWCVWEPDKLWSNTAAAIRQAVSSIKEPSAIKGVAVTGFGMDGLPLDKDGNSLYPLISWHCPRTEPQAKNFAARVGARELFEKTGKQVMIIDSIYRMIWMRENHPDILEKTDKWLLVEDFINFKLCGSKVIDRSMATTTSVYQPKQRKWAYDLIEAAGIPAHIFPEILPSGTVIGSVSAAASNETGLAAGTPVVLGGHDYICAALAVGNIHENTVMNVTGTWEMVVLPSGEPVINDQLFESGYYIESHVAKDLYCYIGSNVCADMLEWFKANYAYEESLAKDNNVWELLMDKAKASPFGANGCFFLPHFSGTVVPNMDSNSLGAFIGLSSNTSKGDMIRAIVEGLDYQFMEMLSALEEALHIQTKKILAVGGATNNSFWMQNKADVTGKLIEMPDVYEATALGAALLAGIGIGVYSDERDAIANVYKSGRNYEPDLNLHEKYADYYNRIYKKIYPSLRDANREIFKTFKT